MTFLTTSAEPPDDDVVKLHHPSDGSLRREVGIDLARGVALISMFVAHTAPSAGPGGVLQVSEFLTFPLFALLVGAGAALGARAHGLWDHAFRSAVQAGMLLLIGHWLEGVGAQIVIVLAPLGVLTLVAWGLARLPGPVVAAIAAASFAVAPWTLEASREVLSRLHAEESSWTWWFALLVNHSYPMAVLVTLACAGVLLTRFLLPSGSLEPPRTPGGRGRAVWATAGITLGVAVVLLALTTLGSVDIVAYVTTPAEQVFVLCLAVGVTSACLGAAQWPGRVWGWCVGSLASAGRMTLTLYTLHVLWLAWWVIEFRPGERDDAWVNVVGMSVAAILIAVAWRRVPWPRALSRGPLEAVAAFIGGLPSRVR